MKEEKSNDLVVNTIEAHQLGTEAAKHEIAHLGTRSLEVVIGAENCQTTTCK